MEHNFSFGIEEEYFLVDAGTKALARTMPRPFLAAAQLAAKRACGGQVTCEMLQAQIEVATTPHTDMTAAHAELRELRRTVAGVAAEHGLAIIAAGTHPTASEGEARQTESERYDAVVDDLQMIALRNVLCGMHVHVELPDPDARVNVMTRMLPFLPLFIALATSSPFWHSRPTGLMGYRLAAYDEEPRTGMPELFHDKEEFDAYVAALVRAGVISDSSFIWWAMRPSQALPTLELRAPDSCTLIEDSIAIAALYRVLARRLYREPGINADLGPVGRALAVENKWRAQRYGIHGTFVDEGGAVTVPEMIAQVIEDTEADAEALGCTAELERCRTIAACGTSADAQIAIFEAHSRTLGDAAALAAVNRWLAATTLGDAIEAGTRAVAVPLVASAERSDRLGDPADGGMPRV
ncbi:MAG: carboxylate-amine ligase [Xanthobacteraceae bacterium]|nr:carboxylate-amine ligase [Xanthobacteraceae bacterium]